MSNNWIQNSDNTLSGARALSAQASPNVLRDAVGRGDLIDVYRFTLSGRSSTTVLLDQLGNNVNLSLINDRNRNNRIDPGETISQSSGQGSVGVGPTLDAGTYFIQIQAAVTTGWDAQYRLNLSATPINTFRAEYFTNRDLSGMATWVGTESKINHNWGWGGPVSSVEVDGIGNHTDNFSARWTGVFRFEAGNYLFRGSADDGMRIWVNDQLILDRWQGPSDSGVYRSMSAGEHRIRVEYREDGGLASAKAWWQKSPGWSAEYYGNKDLVGVATTRETFGDVVQGFTQNWGWGSPTNTPSDRFSARVTGTRWLDPGFYKIETDADDGIRVRIGNQTVIDRWQINGQFKDSGFFRWNGGEVPITIEYFEEGGTAKLAFNLKPVEKFHDNVDVVRDWKASVFAVNPAQAYQPPTDFFAGDWNNPNLIGVANFGSNTRSDGKKGFIADWGARALNGDSTRLPNDLFAIRAYTVEEFDGGDYKFRARGDDGFQILAKQHGTNQWFYITPQTSWEQAYGAAKEYIYRLPQGRYDIHFHMFEGGGNAYFDLSWERTARNTGSSLSPIPQTAAEFSRLAAYTTDNLFWRGGYAPRSVYSDPGRSLLRSSLGNCTWYAHGRLRQLGYNPTALNSMLGNATDWDNTARGVTFSQSPQVGAIAQWESGQFGHVAVVERVNSDGSIEISESSFDVGGDGGADNFLIKTRTIRRGATGGVGNRFPDRFIIVPRANGAQPLPAGAGGTISGSSSTPSVPSSSGASNSGSSSNSSSPGGTYFLTNGDNPAAFRRFVWEAENQFWGRLTPENEITRIESNKDAIIVIHGWEGPGSTKGTPVKRGEAIYELTRTIAAMTPKAQVFVLDWSKNAFGNLPQTAAGNIYKVADWAAGVLRQAGVKSDRVTLVGHSLGAYVASELGTLLGGVKSLVALDPAAGAATYDVDNRDGVHQTPKHFKGAARFSLGLVATNSNPGGLAGDAYKASQSEKSFVVNFEGSFHPDTNHGGVIWVFNDIVRRQLLYGDWTNLSLPQYTDNAYNLQGSAWIPGLFVHEGVIQAKRAEFNDPNNPDEWNIVSLTTVVGREWWGGVREATFWT